MNPFPILNWSVEAIFIAFGIVVIIAILAYATYLLSQLFTPLIQFLNANITAFKAKQELRAKQKEWFAKYANVRLRDGTKGRTVTLNRFIIDAIDSNLPKNIAARTEQRLKYESLAKNQNLGNTTKMLVGNEATEENCSNSLQAYDLASLMSEEQAYENYSNSLGIGLGGLCICGSGYCFWEESIFTQFIVDVSRWKFKSVEIFKDGQLISESLTVEVDPDSFAGGSHVSPDGTYLLVRMDPTAALLSLGPGDMVKVIFKWCDLDGTKRCAIIYNEIPADNSENTTSRIVTPQAGQNGAHPVLDKKS